METPHLLNNPRASSRFIELVGLGRRIEVTCVVALVEVLSKVSALPYRDSTSVSWMILHAETLKCVLLVPPGNVIQVVVITWRHAIIFLRIVPSPLLGISWSCWKLLRGVHHVFVSFIGIVLGTAFPW